MTPNKTYNLNASVFVTLGGVRLTGWGETDAATFEMAADIMEDSVSADGQVTTSVLNDNRVYVDLTVRETSLAYRRIGEALDDQLAALRAGLPIPSLEFQMRDTLSGEEIFSDQATFKTRPGPTKARTAGERVFRLLLPNAADQMNMGSSITQ